EGGTAEWQHLFGHFEVHLGIRRREDHDRLAISQLLDAANQRDIFVGGPFLPVLPVGAPAFADFPASRGELAARQVDENVGMKIFEPVVDKPDAFHGIQSLPSKTGAPPCAADESAAKQIRWVTAARASESGV